MRVCVKRAAVGRRAKEGGRLDEGGEAGRESCHGKGSGSGTFARYARMEVGVPRGERCGQPHRRWHVLGLGVCAAAAHPASDGTPTSLSYSRRCE